MSAPTTSQVPVIGLTGGIGSGKSAAADAFAALGARVVDTDAIAHALSAPGGAAMAPIRAAFGPAVITASGALDRAAMRALAFSDPAARQRLEAILHPLIGAESLRQITLARADPAVPYVMLVVPLLVESGNYGKDSGRVARICVVDCPEETQRARVMQRSALSAAQVASIMATQATRAQRLAQADDIIHNDSDLASMHRQVGALDRAYRRISGQYPEDAAK